ncbi:HAD family hydrolase [Candidatus Bathyarchaeota archaeon]|nr:HAD family hydrolase [Candidatus Bathyarchaeota archaeon]
MNEDKQCIKAVTFDLWETLLFEKDGASAQRTTARCKNLANAFSKFGFKVSTEQVTLAMDKTVSSLLRVWDNNRDITHAEQLNLIIKNTAGEFVKPKKEWIDELSKAYISPISEVPPYLNPDAEKVLHWLSNRNSRIGLICNTGLTPGTELRRFLSREGIVDYFNVLVFSDEAKIRKPDPEIFRLTAQKLQTRPSEIVHVGDNLKSDVWGAKNAGFRAIHLTGAEGRDKRAESDPTSLVSLSRNLGQLKKEQIAPDKTITSLAMLIETIKEMEASS